MLRRFHLLVVAAWISLGLHCGAARADSEADLLKKFQSQNKTVAEKLREEANRLLNPSGPAGPTTKNDPAAIQTLLVRLQDDVSLPREEHTALIRKLQGRLRAGNDPAAKTQPGTAALATPKPALGPDTGNDSKIQVGPAVILLTGQGPIRIPDGGVRVLSAYANVAEARNEGGVPILGGIPYLGRGFRNVGYGRSVAGIQLSASVRIISMAEEEARFLGKK
jgi:hypothetical protein